MSAMLLRNGRLLDPSSGIDGMRDVLVVDGRIQRIAEAKSIQTDQAKTIDATGRWLLPGLIDLNARFGEPGEEYKEDLQSGAASAAAGGFSEVGLSPATHPVIDTVEGVEFIQRRAAGLPAAIRVLAASTRGLEGKALSPIAEMARAGAVAVSDGGHWVSDSSVMRRLLEYAGDFEVPVFSSPREPSLSRGGQIHEGRVSTALGLRGIPREAEEIALARDLTLAKASGAHLHISGLSTEGGVHQLRDAKARGIRVSADANILHLVLTHESMFGYPVELKILPPLRENRDRLALIEALKDGTLDALSSHHWPQSVMEKHAAFEGAEFGAPGLQTTLPLALSLVREHQVSELDVIRALSLGPAQVLGSGSGTLSTGSPANLIIVDPTGNWIFDESKNKSKSSSSFQFGKNLEGRVHLVLYEGAVILHEGADADA